MTSEILSSSSPKRANKASAASVLRQLEDLCLSLPPGAAFPTRAQLMEEFNASDRAVRWALDELRRQGKIRARPRVGSFVTGVSTVLSASNGAPSVPTPISSVVAVAQPDHSLFDWAVELLFAQAAKRNLSLVCRPFELEKSALPLEENALGYIVFRSDLLPLAQQLQMTGQRVVLVGMMPTASEDAGVPNICSDHEAGGYLAMRHLLDLGHRRLLFFGNQFHQGTLQWPRTRGSLQAIEEVREFGTSVHTSYLDEADFAVWRANTRVGTSFWNRPDAPTAVVAWNDHEAVALMSYLSHIGVQIPRQVSVVGYDNLAAKEWAYPALTTIDGKIQEQLRFALDLITQNQAPSPHQKIVVMPTLVCRESTSHPPSSPFSRKKKTSL